MATMIEKHDSMFDKTVDPNIQYESRGKSVFKLFVKFMILVFIYFALVKMGEYPAIMRPLGKVAPYLTYSIATANLPANLAKLKKEVPKLKKEGKLDGLTWGETMIQLCVNGFSGTPLAPKGEIDGFLKEVEIHDNGWYSVTIVTGGWSEFTYGPFPSLENVHTNQPFTKEEIDLMNKKTKGWGVSLFWDRGMGYARLRCLLFNPYYKKGEIAYKDIERIDLR